MKPVIPGLYASAPQRLPFGRALEVRAFLLKRDAGNLLVYSAAPLEQEATAIDELGGVSRQYLNHRHEAAPVTRWVAERFGAPLHVHAEEAEVAAETAEVGATFTERHRLGGDFEVIPTPGHTTGATAYLWDAGGHRALFTGDTVSITPKGWRAAVLEGVSDRDRYIESLELLRGLDFDVLVPWVTTEGEPEHAIVDRSEAERRIDAILDRVRAGRSG